MKTGSRLRYPSKISLLKDLAGGILEGRGPLLGAFFMRARAGAFEIVKELKEQLLLSNS
jgi:hypothetical protein